MPASKPGMEQVSGATAVAGKAGLSKRDLGPSPSGLRIRLLGPLRVTRDGLEVALPRSRKVRTLLGYLALESSPKSRSRLCSLLWDVPSDPRSELRWCLSKLRGVLDDEEHHRVRATAESLISLDLAGCQVDAIEIDRLLREGAAAVSTEQLASAVELFAGDLLDGLTVDAAELMGWLAAQRRRYRASHVAILRELAQRLPRDSDTRLRRLEAWTQLAPFEVGAHEGLLEALVRGGRLHDAEAHLATTMHTFEREGLDWAPLRQAWQAAQRPGMARAGSLDGSVTDLSAAAAPLEARSARPGSVVVMPFREATPGLGAMADGLTDEVITRLAKLRALFVIARGTSYALHERGLDAREAGRVLDVEYVVSGTVRRAGNRLSIHVELVRSRDASIVWAERAAGIAEQGLAFLDTSADRIVAAISEQIERAECKRAITKAPNSLDAWETYHRGLWHMYRFTGPDNEIAGECFRAAVQRDPSFARAYAGLSFTHFQNVFLDLKPDREGQTALALETASRSLGADDRDPAAHWAMGRALWLHGGQDESVAELERSVELSPNFALGHYTLGFVRAQSGDPQAAIAACDTSRQLSPFDPLQFAMLASRALAHMRLGQRDQAAAWAVKAARLPNAHVHILAIAATSLALLNRREPARAFVARIRSRLPGYNIDSFLRAFRFDRGAVKLIRQGAKQVGFAGGG